MDVEQLYDEFGNYVGPEQSDSDSESLQLPELNSSEAQVEGHDGEAAASVAEADQSSQPTAGQAVLPGHAGDSGAVVPAEHKLYYPSADEVFGPATEVLVEEEDAQNLSEPLIAPIVDSSSGLHEVEEDIPPAKYSRAYLTSAIMPTPALTRNIALVGHLGHGKTSFVDMLFSATHKMPWDNLDDRDLPVRYADTRRDEQAMCISVKTTASTFLLQSSVEKSYAVNILDTPGHVNFLDEAIAAMAIADGAVILVDVAEGVLMGTEVQLRKAAEMRLDIVLVISKLDRLCLELRLPPSDAYHKIRHIIDSVNEILAPFGVPELSPSACNVAFSAANENVCFTLKQFARMYIAAHGGQERFPMKDSQLAQRFWGDKYFDRETRKFTSKPAAGHNRRSFVEFVLEPFYKLHTAVVSEDVEQLTEFLKRNSLLGTEYACRTGKRHGSVSRAVLDSNLRSLLKEVNGNAFGMGSMAGFVDMIEQHVSDPQGAGQRKVEVMSKLDTNPSEREDDASEEWRSWITSCDASENAPMAAYVSKLLPDEKGNRFDCLLRILSGRVRVGETIRILGDSYSPDDNFEDQATAVVSALFVPCARFRIELTQASAGQIVLARGIDETIFKSATIVSASLEGGKGVRILRPIKEFLAPPVLKVAIEPIVPSDLPKMVASLRQCVKSFPGLTTKVEDSGEHNLVGSGELYMDCVLRDLRQSFGKVQIRVSDPVVPFAETVLETSALQCYADTPNGQNKMVMVAEPLEDSILKALEGGVLEKNRNSSKTLRDCGWDALAARSLWTFGPDTSRGPNAFLNDVLIQETRRRADDVRESIVQGFCWATREGPLADEPVRSVKMRLIEATIAEDENARSAAQIIPTCRRVVYSSILTGNPRMMEPVYATEIICPSEAVSTATMLVGRRRGVLLGEHEVAGTPLMRLQAQMPVLDSFGFEPDLRSLTHGSAFCLQMFNHWGLIPGDPLDKSVELKPLEPAGRRELARECMVKTRRRKGMGDEVSITKYFDDPLLVELAQDNEELRQLL